MSSTETPSNPSEPARACARCGAELAAGVEDCPRCLLRLALGRGAPASAAGEDEPQVARPRPSAAGPPPTLAEVRAAFPWLEIDALLGQGGMGAVFRARQPGLDRAVALKVLPRALGEDPSFAERFAREARALARLAHPGIVAVHDFGCAAGLHYLLMEFVDGANLRALLRRGPLEARQALSIARELCEALQYAHDDGVVHRDIKPENVLVDARGRVKVADFGLAKLVDGAAEAALTRSDQVMGTPHYMAPEQLERPLEVDHRADLFSLGVVLYEMLTGSLPLGRFQPPSRRVQVDVRLDEIVLKALEHEPARRYQHALEIKTDVEHVSDASGAPPRPPPVAPRAPEPSGTLPRARVGQAFDGLDRGWRATLLLAVGWILLALGWNLGPFALGVAAVLVAGLFARLLHVRVRAVPAWEQALARAGAGQRAARSIGLFLGVLLAVLLIVLGHVGHWERGVHAWQPAPRGGSDALLELWRSEPWALLRFATRGANVHDFVPPESQPRIVVHASESSAELDSWAGPWILILGGVTLLGAVLAASVHVRESRELARRAWHLGAELGSYGLGALLLLWIAAPIAALRRHQMLQDVALEFEASAGPEEALQRLRAALAALGLEPDVTQRIRVIEQRDARELASAVLLRAASPDPFERWSTSFSGPVRESPRVWATVCPRLDGSGTLVALRAGLIDPRTPQFERTHAALQAIEERLGEP